MNKPWLNIQVLPHKNGNKLKPKLYPNYIKILCEHNSNILSALSNFRKFELQHTKDCDLDIFRTLYFLVSLI